jgi:hypothetical protein
MRPIGYVLLLLIAVALALSATKLGAQRQAARRQVRAETAVGGGWTERQVVVCT